MRAVAVAALLTVVSCSNLQTSMDGMLKTIEGMNFAGKSRVAGAAEVRVEQVSQFFRQMKDSNKVAPDAMQSILDILAGLWAGFATARDDGQQLLQSYVAHWDDCHDLPSRQNAEDKYTDALAHRVAHDICREQERDLYTEDQDKCSTVFNRLTAKRMPGCHEFPAVDKTAGTAWGEKLANVKGWFTEMEDEVVHFEDCETSGTNWASKKQECDTVHQTSFETDACTHCELKHTACADEASCYATVQANYDASEAIVFADAAVRISQVATLKFLVCVVTGIKNAPDDAALVWDDIKAPCNDELDEANHQEYGNTAVNLGTEEPCAVDESRCPHVLNTWREANYETDNGHGIAHSVTSEVPVLSSCVYS